MKKNSTDNDDLTEAVRDLTRIMLALNGEFTSKSEIIRKLNDLSIPPNRIAALLGMQTKDVSSALLKAKKASKVQE
jgi:uncharacterized protein (DUF2336 family)